MATSNLPKIFLLAFLVCLSQQFVTSSDAGDSQENYGLLVDAGSSSSKMKLYKWTAPKSISSMPGIALLNSTKFGTPITDYSNDPEGLEAYVEQMLAWGAKLIPESKQSTTPILIQATAGMRFLNSTETFELLSQMREILSNESKNPFAPILHNDVSVISGEEEGVYAWIAANYLLGFFDAQKPVNESVGILEAGGGSTQIAFIPEGPIYDGEFQVRLANRRYSIYVHSYLNMGVNGMHRQIAHQIESQMGQQLESAKDPCKLEGDATNLTMSDGRNILMEGNGNASHCQEILSEILKPDIGFECQPKPCVVGPVYQPSIGHVRFYATQAFTYAPTTLEAIREDKTLDLDKMMTAVQDFCNLTLDDAHAKYKHRPRKYMSGDCMMGNYIPTLFREYGFPSNTEKITLTSKINEQNIDWALGSMLVKLSDRFASKRGHFSVLCPSQGDRDNTDDGKGLAARIGMPMDLVLAVSFILILIKNIL